MKEQTTVQVILDVTPEGVVNITCNDPDVVFYINDGERGLTGPYSPDLYLNNPLEIYKQ